MTSKISFSKLCREHLRHHSAVIIMTIFYFLIQILTFVLEIQNTLNNPDLQRNHLQTCINDQTEPGFALALFAMLIAAVLAFDAFRYLHSKKQTDLYGSLPITRSTMFRIISLNSFLIFFVPLVISLVIETVITAAIGYCSGTVIQNMLLVLLCMTAAFLISWVTAALAMVMTGHSLVALLGFGVFGCYAPVVLRYLIPSYAGTFFATYADNSGFHILTYFSPFSLISGLTVDYNTWKFSEHDSYLWATIAGIVIVGILVYILYLKRPAEAAGRAMAFQKANPVIRFLLVIPLALYSGIYLNQLSLRNSTLWLFIGIILGTFIFHGIVECIYQFDIRALISHKKQLAASMILCFLFTAVFITDAFGYDSYIPKEKDLLSLEISMNSLMADNEYWGKEPDGISGENLEKALSLIQSIIDKNEERGGSADYANSADYADSSNYDSVTVTYTLKNGGTRERAYSIDTQDEKALLDNLFATEDFKDDIYSLYTADRSKIRKIEWDDCIDYETIKLTEKEQDEFLDTYLAELTTLTYSEMRTISPVSELTIMHKSASNTENTVDTYYIYPSFTKTIALLKKHGIPATDTLWENYEITRLELKVSDENYQEIASYQISDPKVLEPFKAKLMPGIFVNVNDASYDDHYSATAYVRHGTVTDSLDVNVDSETGKKLLEAAKKK